MLVKKLRIPSDLKDAEKYFIEVCRDIESICKDEQVQDTIKIAYGEAISNAIIHGNKEIRDKKVYCKYSIDDNCFKCAIEDDGDGFDYNKELDKADIIADVLCEHGRGIKIIYTTMDILEYTDGGKTCYMEKRW